MPCPAVPCRAVRYCVVPCCALLRAVLYLLFGARYQYHTRYQYYTRFVRATLLNNQKSIPSSAQLSYSSAEQRSAVRCRAAPCLALRCGAMSCLAVLCRAACAVPYFEHTVPGIMRIARYQVPVCTRLLVFLLSSIVVLSWSSFFFFRIFHPYCRPERDITNKTTQHRQSALHK